MVGRNWKKVEELRDWGGRRKCGRRKSFQRRGEVRGEKKAVVEEAEE